jgi:hypothetical protein
MEQEELRKIVSQGETSKVQFKQKLDNNDSIAEQSYNREHQICECCCAEQSCRFVQLKDYEISRGWLWSPPRNQRRAVIAAH